MAVSGYNTPVRPSSPKGIKSIFGDAAFECTFSGILSDMDGTLIDSTNAVVRHWQRFVNHAYSSASNVSEILTIMHRIGNEYGIDPNAILATSHGRRSIDVFQQIDPARATWDCMSSRLLFIRICANARFQTSESSRDRYRSCSGTQPSRFQARGDS
jgi:hypothetical protein